MREPHCVRAKRGWERHQTSARHIERQLRAPALYWFSQKATFRNGPSFLTPALYMVERPRPYTYTLSTTLDKITWLPFDAQKDSIDNPLVYPFTILITFWQIWKPRWSRHSSWFTISPFHIITRRSHPFRYIQMTHNMFFLLSSSSKI